MQNERTVWLGVALFLVIGVAGQFWGSHVTKPPDPAGPTEAAKTSGPTITPATAKPEEPSRPEFEVRQCDFANLFKADIKYLSADEAMPLCVRMRESAGFPVMSSDLGELVRIGMVSKVFAGRRGEAVTVRDAALQTLQIAQVRGVMSDRKRFKETLDLVTRIVIGLEGQVSTSSLLSALRASGASARTLSDDGVVALAAMISAKVRQGG